MAKIGKMGTIFSIISGAIFIAWAFVFIFLGFTSQTIMGIEKEFCLITALPILVFGIILVIGGYRQLKGIREGKEYTMPNDLK